MSAAVVLLHAFPLDRRMWRRQLEVLEAAGIRALAPDLGGFGTSREPPFPTTIDAHAREVLALLDHLGIEKAHLVGLSMGGYVALAFAKKNATRLESLLLADTRAACDSDEAREGRETNIEKIRSTGVSSLLDAMLPKLFSKAAPASLIDWVRGVGAYQSANGMVAALAAMRDREDLDEMIAHLTVRTCVIVGSEDRIVTKDEARAMASRMKNANYLEIEGAGHLSNLEQPDAFSSALLSHVRS